MPACFPHQRTVNANSNVFGPTVRCLFAKESAAVYLARFFGRVKYTIGWMLPKQFCIAV